MRVDRSLVAASTGRACPQLMKHPRTTRATPSGWTASSWFIAAALLMPTLMAPTSAGAAWSCAAKDKHTLEATQPPNIGQLKLQLRDYRYCGAYDADFASKIAEAKAYVQQRATQAERAPAPVGCKKCSFVVSSVLGGATPQGVASPIGDEQTILSGGLRRYRPRASAPLFQIRPRRRGRYGATSRQQSLRLQVGANESQTNQDG
jgi:hypothetical protein